MNIVQEYNKRCNQGDYEFPTTGLVRDTIVDRAMDRQVIGTPESIQESRNLIKRVWLAKFAKIIHPLNQPLTDD